ncbi:hypothetical protein A3A39_03170 [Candidatus Kaiserbacteria bacterium RIFCSPLOWO2_01_FULL_54_13]|uniref:Uncharacterized protein n=1 Tax=Candidatus Kaiserbacteria bacterium RIFCSPLOWO2_01_FULL_54_13 TaxID=1798512 RepID=A0A1F6F4C1_9BACT|nr:MAG: hypothetical protein A3A39_03170 [Candidatus Kaiserbacteria bacterium RIFCSPLOWO2_01_FULL_54_13]
MTPGKVALWVILVIAIVIGTNYIFAPSYDKSKNEWTWSMPSFARRDALPAAPAASIPRPAPTTTAPAVPTATAATDTRPQGACGTGYWQGTRDGQPWCNRREWPGK